MGFAAGTRVGRQAVRHRDESGSFSLRDEEGQLGFSRENDFFVPFSGVSRAHASSSSPGDTILLRELGSRNRRPTDPRVVHKIRERG